VGKIPVRIKLDRFVLTTVNDSAGKDEPYLFTFFANLDGASADSRVAVEDRTLPIHFPNVFGAGGGVQR